MPVNPHPDRPARRRHTAVRLITTTLVGLAVLLLAACAGESLPAGWARQEVGALSLAHPQAWQPLRQDELGSREFWQAGVQDAVGQDATVQLLLGPDYSDDADAGTAAARQLAFAQLGVTFADWDTSGRTLVEVPGATSAERWDFTYTGQDGVPVDGVWLFVADQDAGRAAAVQLTGTPLDEQMVFDVVSSLRFDAGAPAVGADDA